MKVFWIRIRVLINTKRPAKVRNRIFCPLRKKKTFNFFWKLLRINEVKKIWKKVVFSFRYPRIQICKTNFARVRIQIRMDRICILIRIRNMGSKWKIFRHKGRMKIVNWQRGGRLRGLDGQQTVLRGHGGGELGHPQPRANEGKDLSFLFYPISLFYESFLFVSCFDLTYIYNGVV